MICPTEKAKKCGVTVPLTRGIFLTEKNMGKVNTSFLMAAFMKAMSNMTGSMEKVIYQSLRENTQDLSNKENSREKDFLIGKMVLFMKAII